MTYRAPKSRNESTNESGCTTALEPVRGLKALMLTREIIH